MEEELFVPKHIGVILDGNRRWAKEKGLKPVQGHIEGSKRVEDLLNNAKELGIKHVTVYAFSTENFKRAEDEKKVLFRLFEKMLLSHSKVALKNKTKVKIFGDVSAFNKRIEDLSKKIEEETKDFEEYNFNICLNYGGRDEILRATKSLANDVLSGALKVEDINEDTFSSKLYSANIPDPDFIIRTSGEQRLSNFLTWQGTYAELYFTKTYWPDFKKEELIEAIEEFKRRNRRFGGN